MAALGRTRRPRSRSGRAAGAVDVSSPFCVLIFICRFYGLVREECLILDVKNISPSNSRKEIAFRDKAATFIAVLYYLC